MSISIDVHEFEVSINRADNGRLRADLTVDGEDIGGIVTQLRIEASNNHARVTLYLLGREDAQVAIDIEPASPLWFKGQLTEHSHRLLKALAKPEPEEPGEAGGST